MLAERMDYSFVADVTSPRAPLAAIKPVAQVTDAANGLTLELYDKMATLEAEWRALNQDSLNSPHHFYDWCKAWFETNPHPLAIVICRQNGRVQFILPLEVVKCRGVRVAQFMAGEFSNMNTGLTASAFRNKGVIRDAKAFEASLTQVFSGTADLVALRDMRLCWRAACTPLEALAAVENRNLTFQLPLLGTMEATIAQVNAKRRRKKYRNQLRRFESMGGYDHVVASTPEERTEILDTFFRQMAVRFEALGLPDAFLETKTKAFFHALAQADHEGRQSPLRLHALRLKGEHDGHICAVAGLTLNGDHVICQFGSIDETHVPDASPGEFLFWLMIEQCALEGYTTFDFGIGDQPYKRGWCPVITPQRDILLPVSVAGRAARLMELVRIQARAFIKRHRSLYTLAQRLRVMRQKSAAASTATEED